MENIENQEKTTKNQHFPNSVLRVKNASFWNPDEETCANYKKIGVTKSIFN